MLHLRPHHLIDIIRNIGHNRPLAAHPYGHAQHLVTRKIMDGSENEIRLVVGADDLCAPCIHLTKTGLCDDMLPQFDFPVRKQTYNDELDHRLLVFLGLEEDAIVSLSYFLWMIDNRIDELVPLCLHPREDTTYRKEGLRRGLNILIRKTQFPVT